MAALNKVAPFPNPGVRLIKEDEHLAVQGSIVFFGMRLQGSWMYLGWLVAAFLLTLAVGVWRMRRYASLMANCYAGYVLLNVDLHGNPTPKNQAEVMFAVVYETIAVAGAWVLAILLRRKRAHLT